MGFAKFLGMAVLTMGLLAGCQSGQSRVSEEAMDITAQALLQGSVPKVEPAPEPMVEEPAVEGDAAMEAAPAEGEAAPAE